MGKKFIYNDKTAIVETDKGRIRGYFYDGMFIFKGVPYAKPDGSMRLSRLMPGKG